MLQPADNWSQTSLGLFSWNNILNIKYISSSERYGNDLVEVGKEYEKLVVWGAYFVVSTKTGTLYGIVKKER